MTNTRHLSHLLMLASSNLPIGSFTYSQGVESAIDQRLITDEASAQQFIAQYQQFALLQFELPILAAMMALQTHEEIKLSDSLAAFYICSRDSHEFLLESQQLAQAFSAWIGAVLSLEVPSDWTQQGFLPMFARLASFWQLPIAETLLTYAFSQIENMTLAVVKTLPLGQMAGQRIIYQQNLILYSAVKTFCQKLDCVIPEILHDFGEKRTNCMQNTITSNTAMQQLLQHDIKDDKSAIFHLPQQHTTANFLETLIDKLALSTTLPHLSQLSCQHESQYSRLFRS